MAHIKVLFFGLGNVAAVMAQALLELAERSKVEISFVFVVRDEARARKGVAHMDALLSHSAFVEAQDFTNVSDNQAFSGATVVVNTAAPSLNQTLMEFALKHGARYADLASDMYNSETLSTMRFGQETLHQRFIDSNTFALINIGIAPGVTNFLVGELLLDCDRAFQEKINSIRLYLLENIRSSEIVFSWSPQVAFDELEQKPRFFDDGTLAVVEPFTQGEAYEFPHYRESVEQYPIYQEEVLSLHQTYPFVKSIRVYSGGSEIELVKSLYQLNLLSKDDPVCKDSGMSVEAIVRGVLPGLKSSSEIDELVRKGVIKSAQFAAMAEINRGDVVEVMGLSFHKYRELSGTPYRGATYVAYPTGVGAATLLFHSLLSGNSNVKQLRGVVRTEELPRLLGPQATEAIRSDLARFNIDLISHTHTS